MMEFGFLVVVLVFGRWFRVPNNLIKNLFKMLIISLGFGLLESGRVSSKDEVNIMVKNVIDVVFGGLSYWAFGYGFTFGDRFPNPFIGENLIKQ